MHHKIVLLLLCTITACGANLPPEDGGPHGKAGQAKATRIVGGLEHPWGLAFLPAGHILVTERPGRLRLIREGALVPDPIPGLPAIAAGGQGGLLDVALAPNFADSRWVYLSYSAPADGGRTTALGRGRWNGKALEDWQQLYRLPKATSSRHHFGSRIAFGPDGMLYLSIGDRGERGRAQDGADTAGSILRLHPDGRIPDDNPFIDDPTVADETFTRGHRNPQGLSFHPGTGQLWSHEHGPRGGDELNRIIAGNNYGWPTISYGREYASGRPVSRDTHKPGLAQPVHVWIPSIAPSGMVFYDAERFPAWQGDLFLGSLKFAYLTRLRLEGDKVVAEERLLEGIGRVREIAQGPDGDLYLLTDGGNGGLYRVAPE